MPIRIQIAKATVKDKNGNAIPFNAITSDEQLNTIREEINSIAAEVVQTSTEAIVDEGERVLAIIQENTGGLVFSVNEDRTVHVERSTLQ